MQCDLPSNQLIEPAVALDFLLQHARPTTKTTEVELDHALGKILAQDIKSNINVPDFDNSAMDGYAISKPQSPPPYEFKISARIATGDVPTNLPPNTSARIFTGAPIPTGTFAVVMQEYCQLSSDENSVIINNPVKENANIRPKANDIAKGETILKTGKLINPQDIALVASVGVAKLIIFELIKVGVFFTGDELISPGSKLTAGKIYNSNRYAIVALLNSLGCKVVNLGNIADNFASTCAALKTLSNECDLIITTGGVSVGEEDHVKPAVENLGSLLMWKIKIKPGKPLAFGSITNSKIPFIGLPGNPVSAFVTFLLFVLPFIKKTQGANIIKPVFIKIKLGFSWQKAKFRREYVRVKLDYSTTPPTAKLFPKQSSDVLSSLVWADGLVEIPDSATFNKGDILNFYSFSQLIS